MSGPGPAVRFAARIRHTDIAWSVGAAGPLLRVAADHDYGDTHWRDFAGCAEADPELFFPEQGGDIRDARAICSKCPVRSQCLDYALQHDERFGIWGGMSERDRRRIKRQAA